MSEKNFYDVVVIGGAAAGLSAALYTSRRTLKTLVVTKEVGGQAAMTDFIENYPGTEKISGPELMQNFQQHAESYGAKLVYDEIEKIEKKQDVFLLKAKANTYQAKAIILAFGLVHRQLNIPGEEKFKGKGVAFCATCDAPLYKEKIIAVVGGGNSALDAADLLAKVGKKVYLIHRRDDFRAEQILIDQVKNNPKIEILYSSEVQEILGSNFVEKIKLKNKKTNEVSELEVNGVFEEIGYMTKAEFLDDLVKLNEKGEVVTDEETKTSCEGIFAAGDCTDTPFKQVIISAGEGAKAGLGAYFYLQARAGRDVGQSIDWK